MIYNKILDLEELRTWNLYCTNLCVCAYVAWGQMCHWIPCHRKCRCSVSHHCDTSCVDSVDAGGWKVWSIFCRPVALILQNMH